MTIVQGTDPIATTVNVTATFIDNDQIRKTVTKAVDYVVINNAVVPDPSKVNQGVIINK